MEDAIQSVVKTYLKSSKGRETLSKKGFQNLVKSQLGNILSDSDSKEAINNMAAGLDENQDGKLGFPEYMKLIGYLATSLSEQRSMAKEEPAQQNATGQVANSHPDKEEKTEANSEVKAEPKAEGKSDAAAPASVGLKLEAPKVEVPSLDVKVEGPKVEVPKVEGPTIEVPKLDVKVEGPKVDVPKVEVPKVDLNVEGPTVEVPKVEVPDVDVKLEGPKVEVPNLDVKVEGPKVELPKVEGDATDVVNSTTTTLNDMVSGAISGVVTEVNKVTDAFKVTEAKDEAKEEAPAAEEKTEETTS